MRRLIVTILTAAVLSPLALAGSASAATEQTGAASAPTGLGASVAISGSTVVAGAPDWDNDRGEVSVYLRHGTAWKRQALLRLGRGTANYQFGASVAISGSTIVVGAPGANVNRGLAYVYVRTGTSWHRQAVLSAKKPEKNASFGDIGRHLGIDGRCRRARPECGRASNGVQQAREHVVQARGAARTIA